MDQETQQKIQERFSSLPEDIQQAMSSADIGNKIPAIGKDNGLHIDQIDKLYLEISLAMLGLEPLSNFTENVVKNVNVDRDKAAKIAKEVNEKIFMEIREALRQIQPEEETLAATDSDERTATLDAIENPIPTKPTTSLMQAPERELVDKKTTNDFIAQKMSANISSVQNVPTNPVAKKYDSDPYREPIK